MMIYGTGDRIVIAPAFGANVSSGPLRYLDLNAVHTVAADAYETGVDAFFDAVLATCIRAQDGDVLNSLVDQLRKERADAELAAWRGLEARLGYDPDEAPDDLIASLSAMQTAWASRRSRRRPRPRRVRSRRRSWSMPSKHRMPPKSSLTSLLPTQSNPTRLTPPLVPGAGEDAARALRDLTGNPTGLLSSDALGDIVGVVWSKLKSAPATARRLPYGARLRKRQSTQRLALQTTATVDRRFELARVVGDAIFSSVEAFGIVSRTKTERQKFQRAFAQSLLCPFSDIRHQIDLTGPTEEQMVKARETFKFAERREDVAGEQRSAPTRNSGRTLEAA